MVVETWLDCRYAGQSHELTVADVAAFHRRAPAPQRLRPARRPGRGGGAAGAGPGGPPRCAWTACRRPTAPRRTGPAVMAEPDCTIWVPAGWRADPAAPAPWSSPGSPRRARWQRRLRSRTAATGRAVSLDPASLQVLRSRLAGVAEEMQAVLRRAAFSPNIKERADCSAALFTADGRAAGPGRAHPRAPGLDAGVGDGPWSVRAGGAARATVGPGEQVILNDPFAGGTHLNDITLVTPCFVGDGRGPAGRVGGQPGPPRRRRRRGARVDPGRRHRDLPGGAAHPAGAAHRRGAGPAAGQLAHARRAVRRPRRPGGRRRGGGGPAGRAGRRAAGRGARLRRAADAGGAGRPARRDVGASPTCSTASAPGSTSSVRAASSWPSPSPASASRSTSPAPTRSGPATSTRSRR